MARRKTSKPTLFDDAVDNLYLAALELAMAADDPKTSAREIRTLEKALETAKENVNVRAGARHKRDVGTVIARTIRDAEESAELLDDIVASGAKITVEF